MERWEIKQAFMNEDNSLRPSDYKHEIWSLMRWWKYKDYETILKIGSGGEGDLHIVKEKKTQAIKILKINWDSNSQSFEEKFWSVIEMIWLNHENISSIEGLCYLNDDE